MTKRPFFISSDRKEWDTLRTKRINNTPNPIHPYVAIIGSLLDEENPPQIFVCFHERRCLVTSSNLLEAVNDCFKVCYILNHEWSVECKHIHYFLSKHVFKVNIPGLKPYTNVGKFVESFSRL